jgi:hypothetical protein
MGGGGGVVFYSSWNYGFELTSLFHPNLKPNLENMEIFIPRDKISQNIFPLNSMTCPSPTYVFELFYFYLYAICMNEIELCFVYFSELIPFTGSMWIQLKWHYKCVLEVMWLLKGLCSIPPKTHTHTYTHRDTKRTHEHASSIVDLPNQAPWLTRP